MNTQMIEEVCQKSLSGEISFPEVVGRLLSANVDSYHVDLIRAENRYYLSNDDNHTVKIEIPHLTAALSFSANDVQSAIRASQAGEIKYPEFTKRILAAGCVYYIAYLSGKRVTYFGRNGDSHTEYFPQK